MLDDDELRNVTPFEIVLLLLVFAPVVELFCDEYTLLVLVVELLLLVVVIVIEVSPLMDELVLFNELLVVVVLEKVRLEFVVGELLFIKLADRFDKSSSSFGRTSIPVVHGITLFSFMKISFPFSFNCKNTIMSLIVKQVTSL